MENFILSNTAAEFSSQTIETLFIVTYNLKNKKNIIYRAIIN